MESPGPIIFDCGSGFTKIGYAGADCPSVVTPTLLEYDFTTGHESSQSIGRPLGMDPFKVKYKSPVNRSSGLVEDWDSMEVHFSNVVFNLFGHRTGSNEMKLSETPFLMSESLYASKSEREKWSELLFEKYDCPAFFSSRSGVLTLYANAKLTGVAVDVGYGGTTITAVQNGYALLSGSGRVETGRRCLGGVQLDATVLSVLSPAVIPYSLVRDQLPFLDLSKGPLFRNISIIDSVTASAAMAPSSASPNLSGSGNINRIGQGTTSVDGVSSSAWCRGSTVSSLHSSVEEVLHQRLGALLRSSLLDVSPFAPEDDSAGDSNSLTPQKFTLPDGSEFTVGAESRKQLANVAELLFDPSKTAQIGCLEPFAFRGFSGLADAITSGTMQCNAEIRAELLHGVVLSGGGSLLPGLLERLSHELMELAPSGTAPRVTAAAVSERPYGSWLGGSILASMGTFPDLWFTKDEWTEHGARLLHRKII